MHDWLHMTAADLGRGIGAGQIDPVDLCDTYLTAIDAHPMAGRIYARVTHDRARAEAAAASHRAKLGLRRSPLDGVPVSWKDLFDTAGVTTEAGTPLMAGRVPDQDAETLRHATMLGLVCLGKTHMSEIAFSGLGINPKAATPPNVHDVGAAPGGSSSGAAASVAYGLAAAAVGSDTGGSVRVPSAWNDLVGLKTTHGAVSLTGTVPLCAAFDTVGPLCRGVEDAALMLGALGGNAPDLRGASLRGARFGVVNTIAQDDLDPVVAKAFARALEQMAKAGAVITEFDAPELNEAFTLTGPLYTAEAWAEWGDQITGNPDAMFYHIRERVAVGADYSAAEYIRAWDRLRQLRKVWAARVAGYDAVLCPTSPILPPQVDALLADDDYYRAANLIALRNTRIGNLMGLCGVSMPTGTPSVGVLLNGAAGGESRTLRLAAAAERVLRIN